MSTRHDEYGTPRVLVIGLGNVLVGDDGFGPFVVRTLAARYELPHGADIVDLGTPGLDLAPHIAGTDALIVIDTVTGGAPGVVRCYRKEDLLARAPLPRTNPHQPGLVDTLLLLELQDLAPADVLLVGAVPARYDTGAPLSAAVRAAVSDAVSLVVCELERLGYAPLPRAQPQTPDIWWEERGSGGAGDVGKCNAVVAVMEEA